MKTVNSSCYKIKDFNKMKPDKTSSLGLMHVNIASLDAHIDDLRTAIGRLKFSFDIIKIFAIVHISTNSRANMKKSISVDPECWYAISISTMIKTTGSKVKNISPSAPGWLFCYLDIELNIEHIAPIMKYFHHFAFSNCLVICS